MKTISTMNCENATYTTGLEIGGGDLWIRGSSKLDQLHSEIFKVGNKVLDFSPRSSYNIFL